jgi:hypothetical protein
MQLDTQDEFSVRIQDAETPVRSEQAARGKRRADFN